MKLAIECDGGQHATAGIREEFRTRVLIGQGISVLRFWNNEVLGNTGGVVLAIQTVCAHLAPQTPTLSLPLPGRGDASGAIVLQDLNLVLAENQR